MFKRIITNGTTVTTVFAAAAVESTGDGKKSTKPAKEDMSHYKCRPSDLPIYEPLHERNKPKELHEKLKVSPISHPIEEGFRVVRTEMQSYFNIVVKQMKNLDDFITTGTEHTKATIDYLHEPSHMPQRFCAIGAGGLAGMILGFRGGILRKLFYAALGGGGVAAICYPKEADIYSRQSLSETKKVFTIAYNFVYGIKPGDIIPENPISKFPTNFNEVTDIVTDIYISIKDSLFSSKEK